MSMKYKIDSIFTLKLCF